MSVTKIKSKQQFAITADLDFGSLYKGINVVSPTSAGDIANKAYVDAMKQALDIKDSCRVATTGAETYTIAAGAVTQITGTSVDGVTLSINDRILIKNAPAATGAGAGGGSTNTTQPANGIYYVTNATTNLTLARSTDADISAEVTSGLFAFVTEGTAGNKSGFVLTTPDPIVVNTTALTFTQFSGAGTYLAGNGLSLTGSTFAVVGTSGRITVGSTVDLATVTVGGTATNALKRLDYDSYGRVSGQQNAVLADIITTIGSGLTANTIFAAPDGSGGSPSFRALTATDIPNLPASKITTGQLTPARGGTGVDGSTATNGQLLIGNTTGTFTLGTLTAGTAIGITNAAGSITINNTGVTSAIGTANQVTVSAATGAVTFSLPQNIHTGATPTFAGLTLAGGTVAVSTPFFNNTQTWNSGATTFIGHIMNITDTASAVGSKFVDYQIAGVSKFSIRKDGSVTTGIWNGTIITTPYGGTGFGTYAVGDILYANTTTSLAKLAGVATGNVLISGGVSTAPSWGKVALTTHVSGILPIANGGLNLSATPSNGQLAIGNGTGYTLATLTGSATVSVTNASGSITLAVVTGSTGVVIATNFIVGETPTGTVDGVNPTFVMANTPITGKQIVYVNGTRQNPGAGNDYTISTATLTFLTGAIPQTGDVILVDYLK